MSGGQRWLAAGGAGGGSGSTHLYRMASVQDLDSSSICFTTFKALTKLN